MNITDFWNAWNAAKPGEFVTYHTGTSLEADGKTDANIAEVAEDVRRLHDAGKLIPVQRRIGSHIRQYQAVKRHQQRVPNLKFSDGWGTDMRKRKGAVA